MACLIDNAQIKNDVSVKQDYSNICNFLAYNLHKEVDVKDANTEYQSDTYIKKEGAGSVFEENFVLDQGRTNICSIDTEKRFYDENESKTFLPLQNMSFEVIPQDLKNEKASENGGFMGEDDLSDLTNQKRIKIDLDEYRGKFHSGNTEIIYNMDEQDDSFDENLSGSDEEVNSSDIEDMFNSAKKKDENDCPLECLICGKTFKLEKNFKKHALSHLNDNSEEIRKFECEICPRKFKKKQHLQRHVLSHTQEKAFACAYCEKSYIDKHDLKKHISSRHTTKNCSICGKSFENVIELKKHQAVHEKLKHNSSTVSCHICQKTFQKDKYLKRHLQIHAKITPFSCDVCNKSFLYPFLLQEHSRTHTGERPFQCDKCDKKFSTKSNLVRHSGTHSRKKIKICNNCSVEFEDDEQYQKHRESCTLIYECGTCGLICEKLHNLRRHMKIHAKYSSPDVNKSSIETENIIVRIVQK